MSKSKITLKELSKKLGVSVSTISKALNDSPEISELTKKKVKEVAKILNYQPNLLAQQLKSGKTNTIGVIVPSIQNDFFVQVLDGIQKGLSTSHYNLIISTSQESFDTEKRIINSLSNGIVDGFIIAVSEETQVNDESNFFSSIIKSGKPIVLVDRILNNIDTDKVEINDKKATCNAIKSLIKMGRKNFGLVSTIGSLSVGQLRKEGFIQAIEDQTNKDLNYKILETDRDALEDNISTFLRVNNFDAIITLDEEASLTVFEKAKLQNIDIQKNLSLLGFLNERLAKHISPSFSTINQHGIELGKQASKLIIDRLDKPNTQFVKTTIDAVIEHRASTTI